MSRAVVVLLVPLVHQWHPTSVWFGAILARLNNGTYHLRTTESMRVVRIPGEGGRGCQRRRELHRSSSSRATGRREGPCCAGGKLEIYPTSQPLRPPGTENDDLLYSTARSPQVCHVRSLHYYSGVQHHFNYVIQCWLFKLRLSY